MTLVLDQGIPRDAGIRLRESGFECVHVGEIGMSMAADDQILSRSREMQAVVLTLDSDFHTILAVSGAAAPFAIRLRLQGLDAHAVVQIIHRVLSLFEAELKQGCLVTVKGNKITCHKLPIGETK